MSTMDLTNLVPTFLTGSIAASLATILFSRSKGVQLPVSNGDSFVDSDDDCYDPFDIAKPEEITDGAPLNEDEFWAKIRARKIIQTLVLTLGFIFSCAQIMWNIWNDSINADEATSFSGIIQIILLAYLTLLSGISISIIDVPTHWSYTIQVSTLSTVGFSLYLAVLIRPAGPRLQVSPISVDDFEFFTRSSVIVTLGIAALVSLTTPRAPEMHFPPELIYQRNIMDTYTPNRRSNVIHEPHASILSFLFFNYVTPVAMLGYYAESVEFKDLPILTARLRSPLIFSRMRRIIRTVKLPTWLHVKPGSGFKLIYQLLVANKRMFLSQMAFSVVIAILYYVPAWFIKQFVHFLELTRGLDRPHVIDPGWGWIYCAGLFISSLAVHVVASQLWSLSIFKLLIPLKIQLNTMLFTKTLVRKDVVSTGSTQSGVSTPVPGGQHLPRKDDAREEEFSSRAQVHTLMTTDVDRVAQFHIHFYPLIDAPIELTIGIYFLYTLLGTSCFLGLLVAVVLIPVNHYGSKFVVAAQDSLMSTRDRRVALMNEMLGSIRMLKFMAWERKFEHRVLAVRSSELKYQRQSYSVQVLFKAIFDTTPAVELDKFPIE